jgi:hypothetical protein
MALEMQQRTAELDIQWQADGFEHPFRVRMGILRAFAQSEAEPSSTTAVADSARAQVVMPDAEKIVLLLRTSLLTLNNALQTGNFTVLRDTGAPGFQNANSAARLSQTFAALMARKVDLSPVSIIAPQLTQPPALDQAKSMLHLKGFFPGQPVQINFEMLYQAVDGRWRLFGLSVQPGPPKSSAAIPLLKANISFASSKRLFQRCLGAVQEIDSAAMHLCLRWQHHWLLIYCRFR